MNTPILFLVFNRPDTTVRVFETIRVAKPARLYVAADGPRAGRGGEAALCEQTRRLATAVDWPCEVKTLFREQNLGCGKAVAGAISWFFDNESEGIILEDDCLPHPDFFPYCGEMLEKFRNNEDVMLIGATNYQDGVTRGGDSYYFSAYAHVWGWASWRRAWTHSDFEMRGYTKRQFDSMLANRFHTSAERSYWKWIFSKMQKRQIDTWDYQWQFSIWMSGGVAVVPNSNLVSNLGVVGTHASGVENRSMNKPVSSILPLMHPVDIVVDSEADLWFYNHYVKSSQLSLPRRLVNKILRCFHT